MINEAIIRCGAVFRTDGDKIVSIEIIGEGLVSAEQLAIWEQENPQTAQTIKGYGEWIKMQYSTEGALEQ